MCGGLEKSTRVDSRTDRALQDWRQALAMHKSKDGRVRKTVTFKTQLARSAPSHPKYFRWNPREQTCELLDVLAKVSPARSYPGLFRVKGSLVSLVFRIEAWMRCNLFVETAEFLIRVGQVESLPNVFL